MVRVTGSVSQRAEPLLRAVSGTTGGYGEVILGRPDLLVSGCRARIVDSRDRVRDGDQQIGTSGHP